MTIANTRLGEVIEANTASFTGQCYQLHQPPELGALVKTGSPDLEVIGVVCYAETHSLDQGRRPIARGSAGADEDVYREHPQLAHLLCTDFKALVVGHKSDGALRQYLPPRPARIHSVVHECSGEEMLQFSAAPGFLSLLLADRSISWIDDVVSACLRRCASRHDTPDSFLLAAGSELAQLLEGDFRRLGRILKKARG